MNWYAKIAVNIIKTNLSKLVNQDFQIIITFFFKIYAKGGFLSINHEDNIFHFLVHLERRCQKVAARKNEEPANALDQLKEKLPEFKSEAVSELLKIEESKGLLGLLAVTGVVATKYIDEEAVWNKDFLNLIPGMPLNITELNKLEKLHLVELEYNLKVDPKEITSTLIKYAKNDGQSMELVNSIMMKALINNIIDFPALSDIPEEIPESQKETFQSQEEKACRWQINSLSSEIIFLAKLLKSTKDLINKFEELSQHSFQERSDWFKEPTNSQRFRDTAKIVAQAIKADESYVSVALSNKLDANKKQNKLDTVFKMFEDALTAANNKHVEATHELKQIRSKQVQRAQQAQLKIIELKSLHLQHEYNMLSLQFLLDNTSKELQIEILENEIKQANLRLVALKITQFSPEEFEKLTFTITEKRKEIASLTQRPAMFMNAFMEYTRRINRATTQTSSGSELDADICVQTPGMRIN